MSRGFTLVETLIAMVLGTIVIGLVSHVFLVQNEYYATLTLQSAAQDNVRAATELLAREIRGAAEDGVVVAGPRTLTIRSPMRIGLVCFGQGTAVIDVYTEGGQGGVDAVEVAGVALRNDSTWEYSYGTWSELDAGDAASASECYANGADTVGASGEYHRLTEMDVKFAPPPSEGDVVMIFRETSFTIRTSALDPSTLGIFRAAYGAAPVEFATGIDTTAQFQYRTGGTTYADTILSTALGDVDAIRIVADARKPAPTGGASDVTFGWAVNVPLGNVR